MNLPWSRSSPASWGAAHANRTRVRKNFRTDCPRTCRCPPPAPDPREENRRASGDRTGHSQAGDGLEYARCPNRRNVITVQPRGLLMLLAGSCLGQTASLVTVWMAGERDAGLRRRKRRRLIERRAIDAGLSRFAVPVPTGTATVRSFRFLNQFAMLSRCRISNEGNTFQPVPWEGRPRNIPGLRGRHESEVDAGCSFAAHLSSILGRPGWP